jgi:hypothetical protein
VKFTDLVNAVAWNDYTLFPESIPHLLHWDLAFLEVLEKDIGSRPQGWQQHIQAWRKLLAIFLLGKVEIVREPIKGQFAEFAGLFEMTYVNVLWWTAEAPSSINTESSLRLRKMPIGVTSPTVLVRPLPDGDEIEQLPDFTQATSSNTSYAAFHDLLQNLHAKLATATNTTAHRLAAVLLREFKDELVESSSSTLNADINERSIKIDFLTAINGSIFLLGKPAPDTAFFSSVEINYLAGFGPSKWVPRCRCRAAAPLTQNEPVRLEFQQEEVILRCPDCGEQTPVPIENFMMFWNNGKLVVWKEREEEFSTAVGRLPPKAQILGQSVQFTWSAISAGHRYPNSILFECEGAEIESISSRQVFYSKILIPGELRQFGNLRFSPTPVRISARQLLTSVPKCRIDGERVTFLGLKLRGVPVAYDKGYLQLQRESVGIGIFPKQLHSGWKKYRLFHTGNRAGLQIRTEQSEAVGSRNTVDVTNGWPGAVSVEDQNSDAGTCWLLGTAPTAELGAGTIYVGLDFGTTNSIVYFKKDQNGQPESVKPRDFLKASEHVAGSSIVNTSFLPAADYQALADDDAAIPSAIWQNSDHDLTFIRWNSQPPVETMQAAGGFKWESSRDGLQALQRAAFLNELLFLTTATLTARYFSRQPVTWFLGVAYPLAFSENQRSSYQDMCENLISELKSYTPSAQAHRIFSVNESYACVRAFGSANIGDVYLTADLGGGSLDLALFTKIAARQGQENVSYHQIGSLAIGGETFVKRVANRLAGGGDSDDQYWSVRDSIAQSSVSRTFTLQPFSELAVEFLPIALEYVRTMLAAFVREHQGTAIKVLLVGNGWRIQQFAGQEMAAWNSALGRLFKYLEMFAIDGARGYENEDHSNTKHLVAKGAAENAAFDGRHELKHSPKESKLPAGRSFKLLSDAREVTIQWFQIVGTGADEPIDMLGRVAGQLGIDFLRDDAPLAPERWRNVLEVALPNIVTYPPDPILRQEFQSGLIDQRAAKGPLQIILERTANRLGEQHATAVGH